MSRPALGTARADWLEELRSRDLVAVAELLGLEVRDRGPKRARLGPCPGCGADKRNRKGDGRAPVNVFTGSDGQARWSCKAQGNGCGAGGDVVALVALVAVGSFPAKGSGEWSRVREHATSLGLVSGGRSGSSPVATVRPAREPAPVVPPRRPPAAEVADLWERSRGVTEDGDVSRWLESRGLLPADVEDLALARALPRTGELPSWARFGRRSWREAGYLLVVPAFEPDGSFASLRARLVVSAEGPKELAPSGTEARGLVLGDSLARLLLAGRALGDGSPASEHVVRVGLVVGEGVPDLLVWGTRNGCDGALESAPAVLSVFAGSWTEALAARVPTGATVTLATHGDEAGDEYANKIARTLAGRCRLLRVKRWEEAES